jgi:hypothetical protein
MSFNWGYPPNRIDLLVDLDGLDFLTCYEKRQEVTASGIVLNIIDRESLISHKKLVGRLQDLADVEKLQKWNDNKDEEEAK